MNKISGKKSVKKFLEMAESDFENKYRSIDDHEKTIAFMREFSNPEIIETADRMTHDLRTNIEANNLGAYI